MLVNPQLALGRFTRDCLPLQRESEKYKKIGIIVYRIDFPILEIGLWWKSANREIRLMVQADEYDYLPVQGWWVHEDGTPLLQGRQLIPLGMGFQSENGHPYSLTRTWLCFKGWREYHDHSSHQDVSWASIRHKPEFRLPGVLIQLHTDLNREGVSAI